MTSMTRYGARTTTSGWVLFAAIFTLVAAVTNLIYGLVLLFNDEWVVLTRQGLLLFDFTTAGVIFLIIAALQFFVGMGILAGELWARILGIIGASLSIISQMAFMSIYPAWSWLIIIIDGLIIYGLAAHGDEVAEI